jgi:hypothetical protein
MKRKISALALSLLFALSAISNAAIYAKTVTVAKSGASFNSPIKAIESINSASAESPVLVKIQPGTYDLGTASLQLKEYVDIEGSGIDKTIITSSQTNADSETCSTGTVVMAMNSSIKNLSVVNIVRKAPVTGLTAGIIFNNVKASAEGIKVNVGSDTVAAPENYGICSVGTKGNATLNNVNVEVRNNGPAGAVAILADGNMSITDSKLAAFTMKEGSTHVIDCIYGKKMTGVLFIDKSQAEGTVQDAIGSNRAIDARDCKATIVNSTLRLDGGNDNIGVIAVNNPVSIDKSKIFSPGKILVNEGNVTVTISNSVIQGELPQQGVKLLKNTDKNNDPIADR